MNLGCNESSINLQVNTLNVKQYSKLDLNGGKGVWSNSMTLGSGSDNGRIAFNKVRIQGGTSRSINVKGTMNVPSLKLFESDFPDCKQAGGKDGTMSWTPLKLKGAAGSELYLACGNASTGTDEGDPLPPPATKTCVSEEPTLVSQSYKTLVFDDVFARTYWMDIETSQMKYHALGPGDCSGGGFDGISYVGSASCDGGVMGDIRTFDELTCDNENLSIHGETHTCNQCFHIRENGYDWQYVIQMSCVFDPPGQEWECPIASECGSAPGTCL